MLFATIFLIATISATNAAAIAPSSGNTLNKRDIVPLQKRSDQNVERSLHEGQVTLAIPKMLHGRSLPDQNEKTRLSKRDQPMSSQVAQEVAHFFTTRSLPDQNEKTGLSKRDEPLSKEATQAIAKILTSRSVSDLDVAPQGELERRMEDDAQALVKRGQWESVMSPQVNQVYRQQEIGRILRSRSVTEDDSQALVKRGWLSWLRVIPNIVGNLFGGGGGQQQQQSS